MYPSVPIGIVPVSNSIDMRTCGAAFRGDSRLVHWRSTLLSVLLYLGGKVGATGTWHTVTLCDSNLFSTYVGFHQTSNASLYGALGTPASASLQGLGLVP